MCQIYIFKIWKNPIDEKTKIPKIFIWHSRLYSREKVCIFYWDGASQPTISTNHQQARTKCWSCSPIIPWYWIVTAQIFSLTSAVNFPPYRLSRPARFTRFTKDWKRFQAYVFDIKSLRKARIAIKKIW